MLNIKFGLMERLCFVCQEKEKKCFISYFTVLSKVETDTLNSSFQRGKKQLSNVSDRSYLHFLEIVFPLIAFQGQKLNIPHLSYGDSSRNFTFLIYWS